MNAGAKAVRVGAGTRRRPGWEAFTRPSMSTDGQERTRRQLFDREGDWYEETVTDPDGSVRYSNAEPLSDHQGRGSAKRKG